MTITVFAKGLKDLVFIKNKIINKYYYYPIGILYICTSLLRGKI